MPRKDEDGSRLLRFFTPRFSIIPEVPDSGNRVNIRAKFVWLLLVLLTFMGLSQMQIVGLGRALPVDPFDSFRLLLASKRGSLMDLGIAPLICANLLLQVLSRLRLIKVDLTDADDSNLYEQARKNISMFLGVAQASIFAFLGLYGDPEAIGKTWMGLIILQLVIATLLVVLLDDLISKGYGIGTSGINLFVAMTVGANILWALFSPLRFEGPRGPEVEGLVFSVLGLIFHSDRLWALGRIFTRSQVPNLLNLLGSVAVFLLANFFQGFKVSFQLSTSTSTAKTKYDIPLFYSSSVPIIMLSALVHSYFIFSLLLARVFPSAPFMQLIGTTALVDGRLVPDSGLLKLISPPSGLLDLLNPLRTVFYLAFVACACAFFSANYIELSSQSPSEISNRLKNEGLFVTGHRDKSTLDILKRYIPLAGTLGGVILGLLMVGADLTGAIGSGSGMLIAVTIVGSITENIRRQREFSLLDLLK